MFRFPEICDCLRPSRTHEERRTRRHERGARDAMDAIALRDEQSRSRTAKSCGPDPPTLGSSFAGDDQRSEGGRKDPVTWESPHKPYPSRRECRIVRRTCGDLLACFSSLQGCGCDHRIGIPRALFEGLLSELGRNRAARTLVRAPGPAIPPSDQWHKLTTLVWNLIVK